MCPAKDSASTFLASHTCTAALEGAIFWISNFHRSNLFMNLTTELHLAQLYHMHFF